MIKLEVRYLDGFTKMLGYSNNLEFLRKELTLDVVVPARIAELSEAPQEAVLGVEMQLRSALPKESLAVLKFSPGKVKNEDALILEITCRTERTTNIQKPALIMQWMDSAHELLREMFDRLTSDALKARMGPKIELEEESK